MSYLTLQSWKTQEARLYTKLYTKQHRTEHSCLTLSLLTQLTVSASSLKRFSVSPQAVVPAPCSRFLLLLP